MKALVERRHAGDHDRRQELGPARARRPRRLARREPADDRRLGRLLRVACARGDLRRRAFLRRLQAEPRLRPADHPGGRGRRRGLDRALRHQRRRPARGDRRGRRPGRRARSTVPLGIHTHNDGDLAVANALAAVRHGATPGAGDDQRPGRALRQRRPVQRGGQPGAEVSRLRSCSRPASSST